jgi:hypothetical protein
VLQAPSRQETTTHARYPHCMVPSNPVKSGRVRKMTSHRMPDGRHLAATKIPIVIGATRLRRCILMRSRSCPADMQIIKYKASPCFLDVEFKNGKCPSSMSRFYDHNLAGAFRTSQEGTASPMLGHVNILPPAFHFISLNSSKGFPLHYHKWTVRPSKRNLNQ